MFLLSQNDENQSENGSTNSKIRLRARPPAEPQKKMLQTKKLRSKSWKTRVFFTFRLPILDGRVHEQVSSVLFFTVFFEGERHDLSKTGGFGRKMGPLPPGKPVTFYECHPEDHAPAPSVRADLYVSLYFDIFAHTHTHTHAHIYSFPTSGVVSFSSGTFCQCSGGQSPWFPCVWTCDSEMMARYEIAEIGRPEAGGWGIADIFWGQKFSWRNWNGCEIRSGALEKQITAWHFFPMLDIYLQPIFFGGANASNLYFHHCSCHVPRKWKIPILVGEH